MAVDGARFQEIFQGSDPTLARAAGLPVESASALLPHLHELMTRQGAALGAPGHGAPISASGPDFVSLPGYSEIFTGRRLTGCSNNACSGTEPQSVADQLAEQTPGSWQSAVVTSWPDIARVASKSARVAVSAGRHAGATRERFQQSPRVASALKRAEPTTPWPGQGDFRRDRWTAEVALAYLDDADPQFLFVGLGEADEFAHQGNYAGYLEALREADRHVGELGRALAVRAARGVRTALFVTADHGRATGFRDHGLSHPESARVWLVAAGSAIPARGLLAAPVPRHLSDIAPTLRTLFGLRADKGESAGSSLTELLRLTGAAGG